MGAKNLDLDYDIIMLGVGNGLTPLQLEIPIGDKFTWRQYREGCGRSKGGEESCHSEQ